MNKITTDFVGTETLAQTKERIGEILDFWLGPNSLSGITDWGQVRTLLNSVSPNTTTIANGELGSSFRPKVNILNDTDAVVDGLLFSANEPGVFLDPTDISTLFQDTAGTVPVTAPGQTVARVNDKSGNGNHATQATAAARPTYGIVPETGRRNLLERTEEFDNAYWNKNEATVVANATVAPNGSNTADKIVATTANTTHTVRRVTEFLGGLGLYYVEVSFKEAEYRYGWITDSAFSRFRIAFDLQTSTVTQAVGGTALAVISTSISDEGNGWRRCTAVLERLNDDNIGLAVGGAPVGTSGTANGPIFIGDGTSGIFAWGASLSRSVGPYQRVGTQFDVTEAGVPSLGYLSFDGVDDFLQTPTITPNTDKVQVFAGVRRNGSGTDQQQVIELSTNIGANNGTFGFAWPFNSLNQLRFQSKGTVFSGVNDSDAPPLSTSVIGLLADISGPSLIGRKDGAQTAQSTGDQGTGNYLAYPMYIGARAGTSVFFNGHIHQLITRFGPNLPAADIDKAERYVASRTAGVIL